MNGANNDPLETTAPMTAEAPAPAPPATADRPTVTSPEALTDPPKEISPVELGLPAGDRLEAEKDQEEVADPPKEMSPEELGLSAGDRLEVAWELELTDNDSGQVTAGHVWWGGTLQRSAAGALEVRYGAEHGFAEETRAVAFWSDSEMRDLVLDESLPWRLPGAGDDDEPDEDGEAAATGGQKRARDEDAAGGLEPGALVKARLEGSGLAISASIQAVNEDGTYDLAWGENLVQGVPADLVEPLEGDPDDFVQPAVLSSADEPGGIDGIDAFFDAFIAALTSGATFQRLSAHHQAVASEKMQALRPFFEAELVEFDAEQGGRLLVTDTVIQEILPRVMARSQQAA